MGKVKAVRVVQNDTGSPERAEMAKSEVQGISFQPPVKRCRVTGFTYVYTRTSGRTDSFLVVSRPLARASRPEGRIDSTVEGAPLDDAREIGSKRDAFRRHVPDVRYVLPRNVMAPSRWTVPTHPVRPAERHRNGRMRVDATLGSQPLIDASALSWSFAPPSFPPTPPSFSRLLWRPRRSFSFSWLSPARHSGGRAAAGQIPSFPPLGSATRVRRPQPGFYTGSRRGDAPLLHPRNEGRETTAATSSHIR